MCLLYIRIDLGDSWSKTGPDKQIEQVIMISEDGIRSTISDLTVDTARTDDINIPLKILLWLYDSKVPNWFDQSRRERGLKSC